MRIALEGLEHEKNFYFGKLQDIEVLPMIIINLLSSTLFFQVIIEQFAEKDDYKDMAHSFLDILYSTEDGFAIPEDED